MSIVAVDLFCGVGGLTHGLQQSGVNVVAGYDLDADCRTPYEENNKAKFIRANVTELDATQLKIHFKGASVKLLAGCAPCQPFSNYTQGKAKDERWELLSHFSKIASELSPELITMENVPELIKHDVFTNFVQTLASHGYHVWHKVVSCPEYGIAQKRKRLVLLASKLGEISLAPPTHQPDNFVTLIDVIGNLPKLDAGMVNQADFLHRSAGLSEINLARIKASIPGGTWKDWPEELLANCHKKSTGKTYTSVYGRMKWSDLSPTITTQCYNYGSGRYGHPTQHRAISLREAAMIQSFPETYKFTEDFVSYSLTSIARMIGNAVPVRLAKVIGDSLISHVKAHS
ncbi:DNA (cytosine-5-)-methyltransferase [Marinomonas primoryensis]|uniref:Cytosine-specific methyltransferase n=1 Tax=Marinomonas primoryensis TaxID=178399 RepID=A0A2Z4PMA0_9GAMM|nr:DNA (cytosine-5-)-methyltransferase [Marinomonas primoryensis]AWX98710.1 DNA (cytosine-5-)-methyltransferase [Marinomonas primoryensis]